MQNLHNKNISEEELDIYMRMQDSPLFFVEIAWGLVPQPPREEYREMIEDLTKNSGEDWEEAKRMILPEHFAKFEKGKHITWQQWLILKSLEKSIYDRSVSRRISISSGHGIGKSATVAMILLWFLYVFKNSQVACTAPTKYQMQDVLWKEASLWISRMPDGMSDMYEWRNTYIRMKEDPEKWFARAQTASVENPEAMAGIHGEHVLAIADEASGVDDVIYNTMEGSLTSDDAYVILISNPTKSVGYFHRTHRDNKWKKMWQRLQFSGEDTPEPIIDKEYIERQTLMHGKESEEYGIRVLGEFPDNEKPDDRGYVPMFTNGLIESVPDSDYFELSPIYAGRRIMGVDPSGEGQNKTVWYIRDTFKAKRIAKEETSNSKAIAQKTIALAQKYGVEFEDIVIDSFGVGADVSKDIAIATQGIADTHSINVGLNPEDEDDQGEYMNQRAEMYAKLKVWFKVGGQLADRDTRTIDQLKTIMFRRAAKGKIQIMPKRDMVRKPYHFESPDDADALALTMLRETVIGKTKGQERLERAQYEEEQESFGDALDKFNAL